MPGNDICEVKGTSVKPFPVTLTGPQTRTAWLWDISKLNSADKLEWEKV